MSKKNENNKNSFQFKAEVNQLLNILSHSLYTHKEIFIRELVSNASDALNKINYIEMTNKEEVYGAGAELSVKIDFLKSDNAIIIKDTGIGMTKEELSENLGTIARSGTKAFLNQMAKKENKVDDIIGQFGVGFYSCFVVSTKVEVITRSYQKNETGYKWSSDGLGRYSITEYEKKDRGTEVIVYLKEKEKEFLEKQRIQTVITKYSNFLKFPVYIENEKANTVQAIWKQPASSLKKEDYDEFYKFISHTPGEPLFKIHKSIDAPIQFNALIFCPEKNYDMFGMVSQQDYGLSLYSNKVLIQQECKELIPQYFRFLKGIVDSSDITLNISRETIQNNAIIIKIKDLIVKSVISNLKKMLKNDRETYNKFYNEFHKELKEGVNSDFTYRDKLAELLLFRSSKSEDNMISLNDYAQNKHPEQKEIYYISGPDKETIAKSPYLEIFNKKNIEVLFLTEPIDEFALTGLHKFEDMEFQSIDKAELNNIKDIVDSKDNSADDEQPEKADKKSVSAFLKYYKKLLDDKVLDIMDSDRLINFPYCLVNPKDAMSSHIQKMMQMMDKNFQGTKKILELNFSHDLVKGMVELHNKDKDSDLLKNLCMQIFDNAMMLEGSQPNLTDMTDRIQNIMQASIKE